ncbi:type IV pilin protein [Xanthomonas phaseoli]|uniref:type IV pilin protein n=1 Tax=Xanthomonas phaseoli TaxID=1985254 RepID=UPI001ADBF690|nr:type IV pilin protein [Xanthomonas phaseoli]MBO9791324.1 type IV pilin protein [Xanthomonas phaseoli pv. dieffenbachiae]
MNYSVMTRRQRDFTLIEIMIVVLIVGVLAAIAMASYKNSVIKTRRSSAAACLQERAQFMERYYTTKMTYAAAPTPPACGGGLSSFYEVSYDGNPTATAFRIRAVPKGAQSGDTSCGTLTIDEKGVRSASGGASDCW